MKKSSKASGGKEGKETVAVMDTIGIDIGDKVSQFCRLDVDGEVADQQRFHTNTESLKKHFAKLPKARIALEASTHSGWMARQLKQYGHEVHVANPRDLAAVTSSKKKSDRNDAEKLARLARADVRLLNAVYVRSLECQLDFIPLQARDGMVRARTMLVNQARSLAKIEGKRLPATITPTFGKRSLARLQGQLRTLLKPLLEQIDTLSAAIKEATKQIEQLLRTKYPEASKLRKTPGVGAITALQFVLTIGSKERFANSRDVGAFLGMTPKRSQSGEHDPKLGISKAGNGALRRLLVQCAHHILGRRGQESALRQWGRKLAERGGANANKRAVVAVARKLSVILHRLWRTGEQWKPFPAQ